MDLLFRPDWCKGAAEKESFRERSGLVVRAKEVFDESKRKKFKEV